MDDYYDRNLLNNYTSFENDDELNRENTNDGYGQGSGDLWKNPVRWESPKYGPGQQANFRGRQGFDSSQRYSMRNASPSSLSLRDVALLPTPPKFDESKFPENSPKVCKIEEKPGTDIQESKRLDPYESEDRSIYPSFRFMRSKIRLGIRAANHPRIFLTPTQLQALGNDILERILGPEGQRVRPRFYGMSIRDGVLAVCCGDRATVAWVRELGAKLSPDGIPLEVVDEPGDGKIYIAVGHFPKSENDSNQRILRFLETQNEGLNCSRWKVMNKAFEKKGAVRMTFSVDFSSAQMLKVKGPLLNYKFAAARFMVRTKRGINFKEEEYEEDDEADCLDNFPPDEDDDEDEDVQKVFPYENANANGPGGFQFGTTSRNPFACPRPGEYEARVAKVVDKAKNSLRFGLTSRERFLNSRKMFKGRKGKNKKKKKVKTEPT